MKFTINGNIISSYPRHVNGYDTAKEVTIFYQTKGSDSDGNFPLNENVVVPLDWSVNLEDYYNLDGKKIRITIEVIPDESDSGG